MDAAGGNKMKATRIVVTLALAVLVCGVFATTAYAQAGLITGNLYRVYTPFDPNHPHHTGCRAPINNEIPDRRFVPHRNPDVEFLVPTFFDGIPLDFDDTYPGSSNET